jgi:hypothetical protein
MGFLKRKWMLGNLILAICLGSVILACDKSSLDNLCADPIGSEGIVLRDSSIFCFSKTFDGCFIAIFNQDQIDVSAISILESQEGIIIDTGMFNCLGNVTDKPVNGYASSVPLILDHGYVVWLEDGTFGRFYTDSFTQATNGTAVDEVNIIWQYSF